MANPLLTLTVGTLQRATADILLVELHAPDHSALPEWAAGAHIDLILPSGLIRQYSLCGDANDRSRYEIAILLDPQGRGGSAEAHGFLAPGVQLNASAPRNHFELQWASRYLFIAGGIGITPLLPMIAAVSAQGLPWKLVYGGRSRASMALLERIATLKGGEVSVVPQDEHGLLDLQALVTRAEPGTGIYSCGPALMLDALEQCCAAAGLAAQLHIERFAVSPAAASIAKPCARAFRVELVRSGTWLDVPADKSLKDVLVEAGAEVSFSCEEGFCGTCETRVVRGVPEHHDILLSAEDRAEGKYMMVCVGRSQTDELALDL